MAKPLGIKESQRPTMKSKINEKKKYPDWYLDDHDFSEIQHLANRGNKALQKMLKELKLIYKLSKDSDE